MLAVVSRGTVPTGLRYCHFDSNCYLFIIYLKEYAESRGFEDSLREFDVAFFRRKQIRTLYGVDEVSRYLVRVADPNRVFFAGS